MLGGFLVGAIAGGLVVWKYRDSLAEYVKGNAGPVREKVDGLLRTVQQRSETLLDQAKEQLSSRLESTREKVRAGASSLSVTPPVYLLQLMQKELSPLRIAGDHQRLHVRNSFPGFGRVREVFGDSALGLQQGPGTAVGPQACVHCE